MTILIAAWEAASMAHRKTSKRSKAKTMLRLADLEQSKNAVLHSLGAASSQESYGHAIDEFIAWYRFDSRCSKRIGTDKPRLYLRISRQLPSSRLTGNDPQTGLEEINGDLREEDF